MQTFVPVLVLFVVLFAPNALAAQVVYVPASAAGALFAPTTDDVVAVSLRSLRDDARARREARRAEALRSEPKFSMRLAQPPREPRPRMRIGRPDDRYDYRMLQLPPDENREDEWRPPKRSRPRRQR